MIADARPLAWNLDPMDALARWPTDRPVLLLHSGRHHPRWARRSILTCGEGTYRFAARPDGSGQSQWLGETGVVDPGSFHHRPFHDLRSLLSAKAPGMWVGYLSYDLGRWIERLPSRAVADRDWPLIELAWCPGWLVYDTGARTWQAGGAWADRGFPDLPGSAAQAGGFTCGAPRSVFTRREYEAAVAKVLGYIAAGDIFQANLAQRFTAEFAGTGRTAPRSLFARLNTASPAWYGAYLEFDAAGPGLPARAIASTSPELFLEVGPDAGVVTRPIKGTRPASTSSDELRHSEKDAAELNMIVDLLRNDLGRVCAYGTVAVTEPRVIETHPTVHHGVATVEGRLHASRDIVDLLRATMPGGSVTGAPKVRAMEIIDELEPVRRGPYCGAIGFLSAQESELNIAIRTLLVERPVPGVGAVPGAGRVDFSVGGGIVADSDPGREFEETLHKAAAMLQALGAGGGSEAL